MRLVFDAGGWVYSLHDARHCGEAHKILIAGKWPDGARLTASDATLIATFLKPCADKRRSKAIRP
jgi:hypothetical protein